MAEQRHKTESCAAFEAMLPEAAEGQLTAVERRVLEAHLAGCGACAEELEAAQRGAAWLAMLKQQRPEPPKELMARILNLTSGSLTSGNLASGSQTSGSRVVGSQVSGRQTSGIRSGGGWSRRWSAARSRMEEMFAPGTLEAVFSPRMAMTAAMAFFSVALTLNLTGVRVSELRTAQLSPAGVERSWAEARASLTRTVRNNRMVYQLESSVSDLRSSDRERGGEQ